MSLGSRRLGLVLVVVGVVGLVSLSAVGSEGPGAGPGNAGWSWMGPGMMGSMHGWMRGYGPENQVAPAPSPGAEQVTVVAREFSFSPSEVRLSVGDTVNLVLANEGTLPHDITIPALGIYLPAAPGTTVSGSLSVAQPGRFEFFCSVPGHREAGMAGVLEVG